MAWTAIWHYCAMPLAEIEARDPSVLDIGCADGAFLRAQLDTWQRLRIDNKSAAIELAYANLPHTWARVRFRLVTAFEPPEDLVYPHTCRCYHSFIVASLRIYIHSSTMRGKSGCASLRQTPDSTDNSCSFALLYAPKLPFITQALWFSCGDLIWLPLNALLGSTEVVDCY